MFYVMAALFVGVGILLLIATRQRRSRPTKAGSGPDGGRKRGPRTKPAERPAPGTITREQYLRELRERSGMGPGPE